MAKNPNHKRCKKGDRERTSNICIHENAVLRLRP
jgi:hypothetical protein